MINIEQYTVGGADYLIIVTLIIEWSYMEIVELPSPARGIPDHRELRGAVWRYHHGLRGAELPSPWRSWSCVELHPLEPGASICIRRSRFVITWSCVELPHLEPGQRVLCRRSRIVSYFRYTLEPGARVCLRRSRICDQIGDFGWVFLRIGRI